MIKSIDIFLIFLTLIVFVWGFRRRTRMWTVGRNENRSGQTKTRLKTLFVEGIAHQRILQERYPGFLHLFVFLGFLLPLFVIIFTQVMFSVPLVPAHILSLILDIAGLLAIISIVLLLYRRYIVRPARLDDNRPEDLSVLLLLLAILMTGILLESLKLTVIGQDVSAWAPLGRLFSSIIQILGLSTLTLSFLAQIVFRIHFFLVLFTLVYIPFSKMFHIISSPLNMFFRNLENPGALSFIDLEDEDAETFGVAKLEEFTWKQLLDLDACTRCGRCQDHCPAFLTEKPLSPKKLVQDLKDHMFKRAPQLLESRAGGQHKENEVELIKGGVIDEDTLWACTTCRSCMDHCPVYVEHVDKIIDMRRYQVLMESQFPAELTAAFKGLERNSNPWGLGQDTRADWIQELDIPVMSEYQSEELDLLFFVGCIRSYDDRNKKVALAMAKILNHLGIRFAVLGMEEGCCGDPARRVGNEYLYQILAQANIETLQRYKIKKILTTCPHCYNTLKNEYPQLGFHADVVHHSTFLEEHIKNGTLAPTVPLDKKLTYHDPCYLGRYGGLFDSPRAVLRAVPSLQLQEMTRTKRDSLCCGAGGGWMWMDEKIGKRINIQRLEDALEIHPEWIATACPFCVTMFDDAIKNTNRENELKIWDIAELVTLALFGDPNSSQ